MQLRYALHLRVPEQVESKLESLLKFIPFTSKHRLALLALEHGLDTFISKLSEKFDGKLDEKSNEAKCDNGETKVRGS